MDLSSPIHIINFINNSQEVDLLLDFHKIISGGKRGRQFNVEVLNKSAMVLLIACWESYVEDLANSAFSFLINNVTSYVKFPQKVRHLASKNLKEKKVWKLAGEGWKSVLDKHKETLINRLHNPSWKNTDELFENLIGYECLSNEWKWAGKENARVKEHLESLLHTRGEISHRVNAVTYVRKEIIREAIPFIIRLAFISSNRIAEHLSKRTKNMPWKLVRFGSIY